MAVPGRQAVVVLVAVTGRAANGAESDLGRASSGAPRPNAHDCASVFGAPPAIETPQAVGTTREAVCDVTTWILGRLCTLGVPSAQTVQDCIMLDRRQLPIVVTSGQALSLEIAAQDLEGHATAAPAQPVVPGAGSYACEGDPCGCCLLTATNPVGQCRGLAGLISPDFPGGLCLAL